jgi:hypothetical protein
MESDHLEEREVVGRLILVRSQAVKMGGGWNRYRMVFNGELWY